MRWSRKDGDHGPVPFLYHLDVVEHQHGNALGRAVGVVQRFQEGLGAAMAT